jgi:acetylornithine/succinyldiaminopimelate/putrescine aminotransferase
MSLLAGLPRDHAGATRRHRRGACHRTCGKPAGTATSGTWGSTAFRPATVDGVTEVRGGGLLIGFDLTPRRPRVVAGLDAGLPDQPRTIRSPPLILTTEQADSLAALPALLQTVKDAQ